MMLLCMWTEVQAQGAAGKGLVHAIRGTTQLSKGVQTARLAAEAGTRALATSGQVSAINQKVWATARQASALESRMKTALQSKAFLPVLTQTPGVLVPGTFQARALDNSLNYFSGTIFKASFNGKEEIYGVVPAHSLVEEPGDPSLERFFIADVFINGQFAAVPGEIVQVAAPKMLDMALVKFRPEDEPLLKPLTISPAMPLWGERLQSQGFSRQSTANLPNRFVRRVNPVYIQTTMDFPRSKRLGLCGSAVVNAQNQLVGIHTGSALKTFMGKESDIGYATRADFLRNLVTAYHHGGKGKFTFELAGQKMFELNLDEFVPSVSLLDGEGKLLYREEFEAKFSYSRVQEALERFPARYIDFTVGKISWDGRVLTEEEAFKIYRYDLYTNQVITRAAKE